jgi:hypothetical protein
MLAMILLLLLLLALLLMLLMLLASAVPSSISGASGVYASPSIDRTPAAAAQQKKRAKVIMRTRIVCNVFHHLQIKAASLALLWR